MAAPRLRAGQVVPAHTLHGLDGSPVVIPDATRQVHLQFRRFAGCPICNLHLRSISRRHDELVNANIVEVAVFHSPAEDMLPYQHELPFAVVADPERALYRAFAVEESRAVTMMHPRVIFAALRGSLHGVRRPGKSETPFGLPADFLIQRDGVIMALKYGTHADDHWSVDEILSAAARSV